MKSVVCINDYVIARCCEGKRSEFFHGIYIMKGSTFLNKFEFPFGFYFEKGKFVVVKDGKENQFFISEFNQTEATLKDLMKNCVLGITGNILTQKRESYEVISGDQSEFDIPLGAEESLLFVMVFGNGGLIHEDDYTLAGTETEPTIVFDEAVEDIGSVDPNIIEIIYWTIK